MLASWVPFPRDQAEGGGFCLREGSIGLIVMSALLRDIYRHNISIIIIACVMSFFIWLCMIGINAENNRGDTPSIVRCEEPQCTTCLVKY